MAAPKLKTAQELVLAKHPNAFVYDDGQRVYIQLRQSENVTCSECGRSYRREKLIFRAPTIGSGGSEGYAWKNAAKELGLI